MTWILPQSLMSRFAPGTAALISDLNEQSQICSQSLLVRSKPSPARIWLRKWKRDNWTRHLSGRILKPSLGQLFAEKWGYYQEDIHASHLVPPESDSAKTTQDISGPGFQMELFPCDQDCVSLRTSRATFLWDLNKSFLTFNELVTAARLEYSQRQSAARLTSANAFSFWATVQTCEAKSDTLQDRKARGKQVMLCHAVRQWPTPQTSDANGAACPNRSEHRVQLRDVEMGFCLPSGRADPDNPSTHGSRQESWATATVSTGAHRQADGSMIAKLDTQVRTNGGKLNPRWVETLMGLPVGWTMPSCASPLTIAPTNCDYLATESFQPPQNEPSEF